MAAERSDPMQDVAATAVPGGNGRGKRPRFRADTVGSLLRPAALLAAREAFQAGRIGAEALQAAEDEAVRGAVRLQEELGFGVVTDGEYRRENWWIDFIRRIGGVEISDDRAGHNTPFQRNASDAAGAAAATSGCGHETCAAQGAELPEDAGPIQDHDFHYVPKNVRTVAKLRHDSTILGRDYEVLAAAATRTAKITLPSPTRMHFHGGRAAVSRQAYPDIEEFFADVARLYQEEIAGLEARGCRYVQIDDPLLTYFLSERLRAEIRSNGEEPEARLARYVRLVNDCIGKRRPDTWVGIHLCRGNSRSGWISEGGYEGIAEAALGGLAVDAFLLEYDDARSGDFHPLRYVPRDRCVVLGLVTTKRPNLETRDGLRRRIEDASHYVDVDRLAVSPQCGFASIVEGNLITEEDQRRKLALVVETAHEVWGTA